MDPAYSGHDYGYCSVPDYEIEMVFTYKIDEFVFADASSGDDEDTGEDFGEVVGRHGWGMRKGKRSWNLEMKIEETSSGFYRAEE